VIIKENKKDKLQNNGVDRSLGVGWYIPFIARRRNP
jgi:hypothetical protein